MKLNGFKCTHFLEKIGCTSHQFFVFHDIFSTCLGPISSKKSNVVEKWHAGAKLWNYPCSPVNLASVHNRVRNRSRMNWEKPYSLRHQSFSMSPLHLLLSRQTEVHEYPIAILFGLCRFHLMESKRKFPLYSRSNATLFRKKQGLYIPHQAVL